MSAAARGGESLRRFRARLESRSTYPGRQSQRLEADPLWRPLQQCCPPIAAVECARRRDCSAEALSQPQRERPTRYGSSRRGQSPESPVLGTRSGGASDLRPHLMWGELILCLAADFNRLSRMALEVHRCGTEPAAA